MIKKILVVSPVPSHPQNAGNRARIYSFLKSLQEQGCEIHFLYNAFYHKKERNVIKEADISAMKKEWNKIFYFNPHKTFYYKYNDLIGFLGQRLKRRIYPFYSFLKPIFPDKNLNQIISGTDAGVDSLFPLALERYIKRILKKQKYDLVISEYVYMSKSLDFFDDSSLKIIDTHDAYSSGMNNEHFLSVGEEIKGLGRADIIIAIQNKEKEYFKKILKAVDKNFRPKVITIGHSIRAIDFKDKTPQKNILFIGTKIVQNLQGINFFIKKVLPLLKKEIPDIKLKISGNVCNEIDSSGYEKLGVVENLNPIYENSDLIIAPIFTGSGLKIKAIEGLSHNLPVVCTSHVASAFGNLIKIKNSPLLVADTAEEFVNQIKKVFQDGNYNKLRKNAYKFAKRSRWEVDKKIDLVLNYKK